MKPQTQSDLAAQGCSMPNCDGNHEGHTTLYVHGRCHPRAHSSVSYEKTSGVLSVCCGTCQKRITDFQVAAGDDLSMKHLFRVAEETVFPQMQSAHVQLILYTGKHDGKLAIELGMAVLTGKPMIVTVHKGAGEIPPKLAALADEIIPFSGDAAADAEATHLALDRLTKRGAF